MRKYSLQISVTLVILIVLLILYGCGTRKTDLQVKDSIHIENNYSQGTKIVLGNTFTYKPFDSLKPMIIDNVVYKNVIITNDKTNTVTKWTMEIAGGNFSTSLSSATIIFGSYPKTIYKRPDGSFRLKYYNNSDTLVITTITT